jgi:hypothetical protein
MGCNRALPRELHIRRRRYNCFPCGIPCPANARYELKPPGICASDFSFDVGHNCVWHNQLPDWVTAGNFDKPTLLSIVQNHCGTLVKHYKGKIYSWDVINEAFNDDGTFRQDVFFNTTGTDYIKTALRAARAADPHAKLYINDFNIEGRSAKSTALQNLVKELKSEGVPIDGVGIQSHLIVGEVPTTYKQNMEDFTALGVEVAVTELDVRMNLPATPALLAQQATDYETVVAACASVKGCVGVTLWDWTDKVINFPTLDIIFTNVGWLHSFRGFPAPLLDKARRVHGMRSVHYLSEP